jgi:hypothetical protein
VLDLQGLSETLREMCTSHLYFPPALPATTLAGKSISPSERIENKRFFLQRNPWHA